MITSIVALLFFVASSVSQECQGLLASSSNDDLLVRGQVALCGAVWVSEFRLDVEEPLECLHCPVASAFIGVDRHSNRTLICPSGNVNERAVFIGGQVHTSWPRGTDVKDVRADECAYNGQPYVGLSSDGRTMLMCPGFQRASVLFTDSNPLIPKTPPTVAPYRTGITASGLAYFGPFGLAETMTGTRQYSCGTTTCVGSCVTISFTFYAIDTWDSCRDNDHVTILINDKSVGDIKRSASGCCPSNCWTRCEEDDSMTTWKTYPFSLPEPWNGADPLHRCFQKFTYTTRIDSNGQAKLTLRSSMSPSQGLQDESWVVSDIDFSLTACA